MLATYRVPRTLVNLAVCIVTLFQVSSLKAELPAPPSLPNPRLYWVFPAGGCVGTTIEATIRGIDLDDANALVFDHPGITADPKLGEPGLGQSGPQPVPNAFTISISTDVKPGLYEVRAKGKYGLSSPRSFMVGTRPEILETVPNNSLKQAQAVSIGVTINGSVDDAKTDYFRFSAKRGQRIIIDCWGFRIDSNLAATLVLFDANGKELERHRHTHDRDAMLDFTAPEDGDYVLGLFDAVYNYYMGPGYCFYRLSITTAPYLDYIFPPAGLPGSSGQYTLYGRNLSGGEPVPNLTVAGKTLEKMTIQLDIPDARGKHLVRNQPVGSSEAFIDAFEYRLDSPAGLSNPVLVSLADAPVTIEQEPNDDPVKGQMLQLPCEVAGQFYPVGDQDWYAFNARKGDVYYIEVISQRLGLRTDPHLVVQQIKTDANGAQQTVDLHSIDDMKEVTNFVHWSQGGGLLFNTSTHDPACRFVAPDDGTYRVAVQDLAHLAKPSPKSVYRLVIRPPQPDYRLVAMPRIPLGVPPEQGALTISQNTAWSPNLRRGGSELVDVFAIRRDGFDGDICVTVDNLPTGVTCEPAVLSAIPLFAPEPVKRSVTLVLKAAEDAPTSVTALSISGKAKRGDAEIIREVRTASMVWPTMPAGVTLPRSRLVRQMMLTVDDAEAAPFSLDVSPNLVLETSKEGTVKFPVKAIRRGDFKGPLTLKAYGMPMLPGNMVHRQLIPSKPLEIKADQEVGEFILTVPNGVPTGTYTIFVNGIGTVKYARNPQAFQVALDRKSTIEKIVAEDAANLKTAIESQAEAEKKRQEAVTGAMANQVKAATDAKATSDKTVLEIDARSKKNAAFLQTFNQDLAKLQEKCKPTDLLVSTSTSTITLKARAAPITMQPFPSPLSVKPGNKVDMVIAIKRLENVTEPIHLSVRVQDGTVGISMPVQSVVVGPGENQGTLVIQADASTPPLTYAYTVTATVNIDGTDLVLERDYLITNEKL